MGLDLAPHGSWLSPKDRRALSAHMAVCEACRQDYQESQTAIVLLRKYWQVSEDTKSLLATARTRKVLVAPPCARWMVRTAAMAACLIVGVLCWWEIPDRRVLLTWPESPVASSGRDIPPVVDLTGADACIAMGATIRTPVGQSRGLILDGRHQLAMNAGTRLSIEPLVDNDRMGYLVSLTFGEVYARVEHDGNPFVVQTAFGRAAPTGAIFDVKATATDTTLVVVEGSVRFESLRSPPCEASGEGRTVQVAVGQQSTVGAASPWPSGPTACDALALTAWARADRGVLPASQDVLAGDLSVHEVPVPAGRWVEVQTDLDRIDDATWMEQKRDWFEQQFPWIFELRDALATERSQLPTEIPDYSMLLMQSGDIWRFAYPEAGADRRLGPDPNGLLRAAARHGRDESWLEQQTFVSLPATGHVQQATGGAAFDRWVQTIEADNDLRVRDADSKVLHETLDACVYLMETRTLAILVLNQDPGAMTPSVRRQVLALLHEELRILRWCVRLAYELSLHWSSVSPPECSENVNPCECSEEIRRCECPDSVSNLLQEIRKLGELEKQLRAHEGIPGN